MNCLECNKPLESEFMKFCSTECWEKHNSKKIKKIREWQKNNPDKVRFTNKKSIKKFIEDGRMKKLMKQGYLRNKEKWISRNLTNKIINGKYGYKQYPIKRFCKKCGMKTNLEIHHETYPKKCKEIKKAIDEEKIYFLCKYHHLEIKNKYILTNE